MNRNQFGRGISTFCKYAVLCIASFVSIFPFIWMFISTTNTSNDIAQGSMALGHELSRNINRLFSQYDVGRILFNSFFVAVVSVLFSLLVTSLAAFGFEKFRTKTSERIYSLFLLSMMIPFAALMIPLFQMMASLHMVNTLAAVILPAVANTFLIFFFRQNFQSFPNDILESARIDGASNMRSFFTIVVPSMRATYAAGAVYAFMTAWNNYMWPLVILQSDNKKTMTLFVSGLSTASYMADYGVQMVALVVATIPMMLIFLFMQRSFVEGMTGSVKG